MTDQIFETVTAGNVNNNDYSGFGKSLPFRREVTYLSIVVWIAACECELIINRRKEVTESEEVGNREEELLGIERIHRAAEVDL